MRRTITVTFLAVVAVAAAAILAGCRSSVESPTPIPRAAGVSPRLATLPYPADSPVAPASGPGSLPSPEEELWVIVRSPSDNREAGEESPGTGALLADLPGEAQDVPMPLKHTEVKAEIAGYIANVQVRQQFHNPYDVKIEAVYVFPLPHNAAINEFVMTIGERRIRGVIREREEAERIYDEAKRQGYVASLLTQERPNVFRQSVANIEPGRQIDVTIRYFHTLAYDDGWFEFVFPMVVGPRFNPPGFTDGIGAVARGRSGISNQRTEVEHLKPNERSGHDLALQVDLDAGVPIEETLCRSHAVTRETVTPERLTVALAPNDRIPNKDFVLRYRVAGDRIKSGLLTHRDERGGYFTLMVLPPAELTELRRQPLELVFVLDCSGSMSGQPIQQAKAAVERALRRLQPGDSFQLINFSFSAAQLGSRPLEATPENVRRGLAYLRTLEGEGGTMMMAGIKAALDFPHDPRRLRFVCFLTDGFIGNDTEILEQTQTRLGVARIFSFGVGSAPNRYLLDHLAKLGRGAVAYLGLRDDASAVMDRFFERIGHPAMTDVQIDWGTMQVSEVFPVRLPDLFVGRPLLVTGRFQGAEDTAVRIHGQAAGQPVELSLPASLNDPAANHPALASVWARMKIADLSDLAPHKPSRDVVGEIRQVALDYALMSAYTAFVAVDSSQRTRGAEATTVPVAVPVPEGVKYDTTVQEQ